MRCVIGLAGNGDADHFWAVKIEPRPYKQKLEPLFHYNPSELFFCPHNSPYSIEKLPFHNELKEKYPYRPEK